MRILVASCLARRPVIRRQSEVMMARSRRHHRYSHPLVLAQVLWVVLPEVLAALRVQQLSFACLRPRGLVIALRRRL